MSTTTVTACRLPLVLASVLLASCAPFKKLSPPGGTNLSADTIPAAASAGAWDTLPEPLPPLCAELDEMDRQAAAAAKRGEYALAHRLAGAILRAADSSGGTVDAAEYYNRVARLYSGLMPQAYADSAPESVTALIFQNQISGMFDTSSGRASDSLLREMIDCQRSAIYTAPVVYNDRVRQVLGFFAQARKDQVARWLDRARVYLPTVGKLLADSGLPSDLAYLPLIESGYNPCAYSSAHASGIWQFIESTGEDYGLRTTYWVDERRDPIRSTMAAISYLRKLYAEFGNWHLALAAYNYGENGVQRAIDKSGSHDYWTLRLPRETMEYVPKFIAALIVARNPSCFGLALRDSAGPSPDTVHVSDCLDLGQIAQAVGVSRARIEALNPHLLHFCTPPDVGNVTLYVPAGKADAYRRFAAKLTPAEKVKWVRYTVQPGDNLAVVARRFATTIPALRSVNRLTANRIVAGKTIFIPVSASGNWAAAQHTADQGAQRSPKSVQNGSIRYRVKQGETLSSIADLFGTTVALIRKWNALGDAQSVTAGSILTVNAGKAKADSTGPAAHRAPASTSPRHVYKVQAGDNLSTISRRLGIGVADLLAWNGMDISNPRIKPGEELAYYGGSAADGASAPAPPRSSPDTLSYQVQPGDNLTRIAETFYLSVDDLAQVNGFQRTSTIHAGQLLKVPVNGRRSAAGQAPGSPSTARERLIYYEVKRGDNLWSISQAYRITLQRLCSLNGLSSSARLRPGDTLTILTVEDQ